MTQYIDKSAVVAEIEKRQSIVLDPLNNNIHTKRLEETYKSILSFINTLKVKEVDFDEEFRKYHIGIYNPFSSGTEIYNFAKHFFELGLAQKGE